VVDRVAQSVAVAVLEPKVEKVFHDDSYGYRPGRSPLDAVKVCRKRCWKKDWVLDLDVKAFFDSVPWDLMLSAVARHTDSKWVLLYVERWLKAPMLMPDGSMVTRTKGTPQGALCAAAHKPPYEQRWVMHSGRGFPLVGAVVATGRCA
jgi:retron-type reverse transcriptase